VEAIERFAFYDRVREAHAIVLTGELQPYANFVFKKGVIGEALVR
jgi:L-fucose mutarotase